MKKIIVIWAMLCFVFTNVHSQSIQSIKVIDKTDKTPLAGVSIYNKNKSQTGTSDASGRIPLYLFKPGDTLYFSYVGYATVNIPYEDVLKGKHIEMSFSAMNIDVFVLSANKVEEKLSDIPQKISIIDKKDIQFANPLSSASLLEQSGQIFVQQSQFGGGSPIIRGFEANRVVLVLDGIKMNNAIYRSGHLQNVITIDPEMLEKTEIINGPGSVIYGSDAIGGVLAFYTKSPYFSVLDKITVNTSMFTRYSSAANEKTGGLNINIGSKKWASLTHFTYKNLGDLKAGNIRNPFYGDWGKCLYYSERVNGQDSMIQNENPNIQKGTGYSQQDFMQKFNIKTSSNSLLKFNFQYSNSSDIPRYDRLSQYSDSTLKYAEWFYGPQSRILGAITFEQYDLCFADKSSITFAYQNINEDRISRKFNQDNRRHQEEQVGVLSLNVDFMKEACSHELRYGIEFRNDKVESNAYYEDVNTSAITYDALSRYPDDYNKMFNAAAYLTHSWEIGSKLILSQGIRYNIVNLQSAWTDTMMNLGGFSFEKTIEQNNSALTGNAGIVFMPGSGWRFAFYASTGFRAPNVDDVGKVNDSNSDDLIAVTPSINLKPEYIYSTDLTISKNFSNQFKIEVTGFYSYLDQAIILRAGQLNGSDSVLFDGVMSAVYSNTNAGAAQVIGMQSSITADISENFSFKSYITYTHGRVIDDNSPMDHIPPAFGQSSLRYRKDKFSGEFYVAWSSWKRLKDYSPGGEDNLAYATIYGVPSWTTLNLRASYAFGEHIQVIAGLENITDAHYRKFASGVSSPGRNLFLSLRANF